MHFHQSNVETVFKGNLYYNNDEKAALPYLISSLSQVPFQKHFIYFLFVLVYF